MSEFVTFLETVELKVQQLLHCIDVTICIDIILSCQLESGTESGIFRYRLVSVLFQLLLRLIEYGYLYFLDRKGKLNFPYLHIW